MSVTRHSSPELDPVVLLCTILTLALLAFTGWTLANRAQAAVSIHCPAPDHAVWASSLHQWLCGDSFTGGVKSR